MIGRLLRVLGERPEEACSESEQFHSYDESEVSAVNVLPFTNSWIESATPNDRESDDLSDRSLQTKALGGLQCDTSAMPPQSPQVPLIRQQGRNRSDYEFHSLIGEGSLGKVFEATRIDTGEHVAIKVVKKSKLLHSASLVKMVRDEVNVHLRPAIKRNPFIVKLHGSFQDEAFLYYAFELVKGGTLTKVIERLAAFRSCPVVPLDLVRLWMGELLSVVWTLNQERIVHRDLKPDNILLADGHIRVIDFNNASIDGKAHLHRMRSAAATDSGSAGRPVDQDFGGTIPWWAPERVVLYMARTSPTTRASNFLSNSASLTMQTDHQQTPGIELDIWALGCIMYEMFTGRNPFLRQTADLTAERIMRYAHKYAAAETSGAIANTLEFPPSIGPLARDFCLKLLDPSPARRLEALPADSGDILSHPFLSGYTSRKSNQPLDPAEMLRSLLRSPDGPQDKAQSHVTASALEFTPEPGQCFEGQALASSGPIESSVERLGPSEVELHSTPLNRAIRVWSGQEESFADGVSLENRQAPRIRSEGRNSEEGLVKRDSNERNPRLFPSPSLGVRPSIRSTGSRPWQGTGLSRNRLAEDGQTAAQTARPPTSPLRVPQNSVPSVLVGHARKLSHLESRQDSESVPVMYAKRADHNNRTSPGGTKRARTHSEDSLEQEVKIKGIKSQSLEGPTNGAGRLNAKVSFAENGEKCSYELEKSSSSKPSHDNTSEKKSLPPALDSVYSIASSVVAETPMGGDSDVESVEGSDREVEKPKCASWAEEMSSDDFRDFVIPFVLADIAKLCENPEADLIEAAGLVKWGPLMVDLSNAQPPAPRWGTSRYALYIANLAAPEMQHPTRRPSPPLPPWRGPTMPESRGAGWPMLCCVRSPSYLMFNKIKRWLTPVNTPHEQSPAFSPISSNRTPRSSGGSRGSMHHYPPVQIIGNVPPFLCFGILSNTYGLLLFSADRAANQCELRAVIRRKHGTAPVVTIGNGSHITIKGSLGLHKDNRDLNIQTIELDVGSDALRESWEADILAVFNQ